MKTAVLSGVQDCVPARVKHTGTKKGHSLRELQKCLIFLIPLLDFVKSETLL